MATMADFWSFVVKTSNKVGTVDLDFKFFSDLRYSWLHWEAVSPSHEDSALTRYSSISRKRRLCGRRVIRFFSEIVCAIAAVVRMRDSCNFSEGTDLLVSLNKSVQIFMHVLVNQLQSYLFFMRYVP